MEVWVHLGERVRADMSVIHSAECGRNRSVQVLVQGSALQVRAAQVQCKGGGGSSGSYYNSVAESLPIYLLTQGLKFSRPAT